jgi:hypothetical protein
MALTVLKYVFLLKVHGLMLFRRFLAMCVGTEQLVIYTGLHAELWALLAFEKAIYPSRHLSLSCPCTPSNYRSGEICSYNFHGHVTYQSVHIVLLNQRVGMHRNHASFVYL